MARTYTCCTYRLAKNTLINALRKYALTPLDRQNENENGNEYKNENGNKNKNETAENSTEQGKDHGGGREGGRERGSGISTVSALVLLAELGSEILSTAYSSKIPNN